jgi:1-acyl-sn-glycerol-3-phosphate acyltransferase
MLFYISREIFILSLKIMLKIRVFGQENLPKPPFIITSNHASLMDPPMVALACRKYPVNFMAKQELFDHPIMGFWTRNVRCIPTKRGKNAVKGIKEALRRLKKGCVVGVFPEGTRSEDGSLQEAKIGTGFLMVKAEVPVVPVFVYGSAKAFPKGKSVVFGTKAGAIIGKPISPEEYLRVAGPDRKDYETVSSLVMDRIGDLKKDLEEGRITL